mmetsp:Transcript_11926/g.19766  ORF Transcript_11926/g.19766 Transcript_11926/m.19766 type:complete len:333 (-) Transcript_11926:326-1324(-)
MMAFRSLAAFAAAVSSVVTVNSQAVAPPGGCLICGDDSGQVVTAPDTLWTFPGQPITSCGELEDAGLKGDIPLNECSFLRGLVDPFCMCAPGEITSSRPPRPTSVPTLSPAPSLPRVPTPCPRVPVGGCSVCGGEGVCVTNPDAVFAFPGQLSIPCGEFEQAGLDGLIPLDQCPFLSDLLISDSGCECAQGNLPPSPPTPVSPPSSISPTPPIPILVGAPTGVPSPTQGLPASLLPSATQSSPSAGATGTPITGDSSGNTHIPTGMPAFDGGSSGMGMGSMGGGMGMDSDDGLTEPPVDEPASSKGGMGMGGMRRTSSARAMMEGVGTIRGL